MLLAGDELGNSQAGNNNAYAQDNDVGWVDWSGLKSDPAFLAEIRKAIHLRQKLALLRQSSHLHGRTSNAAGFLDIDWLGPDGKRLTVDEWLRVSTITVLLCDTHRHQFAKHDVQAVALLFNMDERAHAMQLPQVGERGAWHAVYSTAAAASRTVVGEAVELQARSLACLVFAERVPAGLCMIST
jgi:glycogen operon protein